MIEEISAIKSCFFGKIKKIDKPLAQTDEKGDKVTKTMNEKGTSLMTLQKLKRL